MYWEKKNQLEKLTKTKSEVKWVTGRHSQDRDPASAGTCPALLCGKPENPWVNSTDTFLGEGHGDW